MKINNIDRFNFIVNMSLKAIILILFLIGCMFLFSGCKCEHKYEIADHVIIERVEEGEWTINNALVIEQLQCYRLNPWYRVGIQTDLKSKELLIHDLPEQYIIGRMPKGHANRN